LAGLQEISLESEASTKVRHDSRQVPHIVVFPRQKLVLASGSPRRRELLKMIGLEFEVAVPDVHEGSFETSEPSVFVTELALAKALSVSHRFREAVVVGADTVVVLDRERLGKPSDATEAASMLRVLGGRTHTVYTGVALVDTDSGLSQTGYERSSVTMKELSEGEISRYVATNEPMDKAGSYGIQGIGAVFIKRINGCYFNVMGLPLARLYAMAEEFAARLESERPSAGSAERSQRSGRRTRDQGDKGERK
jgi:septum formation protein